MRSIRGGMGLGDAIYVQAVARYLVARGERLEVCTAWPDVFAPIAHAVQFAEFRRQRIDVLAHYSARKGSARRQFEDVCDAAGLPETAPLAIDWSRTSDISDRVRSPDRPMILVGMPRPPMARIDGFGKELMPERAALEAALSGIRGRAQVVMVGAGEPLYRFNVDLDLSNRTTVPELFDLAMAADGFLGWVSYLLPLAEVFSKRAFFVWSTRGLRAGHTYVRQITPAKIIFKPETTKSIFDSAPLEEIERASAAALL